MPSINHSVAQLNVIAALLRYEDKFSILPELSLELDGQPFVPDVSIYPRLRVDWRHDEVKRTDPPLMVVEILSPKQSLDALMEKAEGYLKAGVRSCWIVQPVMEAIAILVPGEKPKIVTAGQITDPATEITIQVEEIFK